MKKYIKEISILATLLLSAALATIAIYAFGTYGWTVFFVIPALIGILPPVIAGSQIEITLKESYTLSFLTLGLSVLCLLVFAIEGLVCIAMATPMLIMVVWGGSYLGYKLRSKQKINPTNSTVGILILCLGSMGFDYVNDSGSLIPVSTSIIVDAPIQDVWHNVVTFKEIDEPTEWIFKTGISCPTDATIDGTGVGAIRYCNFTTCSFVEPITTWDEPNLLQFDVVEQPIPMNEFNPFWDIQPPHLDGYFLSKKGQFKLTEISDSQTKLEGTTWYKLDIMPQVYWQIWSDFIVHKIHNRVSNHIKIETEKEQLHNSGEE